MKNFAKLENKPENHSLVTITTTLNGTTKEVRFWLPAKEYENFDLDEKRATTAQLTRLITTEDIPNDVDVILEIKSVRRSRSIADLIFPLLLEMLTEESNGPFGSYVGTPTVREALERPTSEKVIEVYRKEGIKGIKRNNNIYANVALLALYMFEGHDWRPLRYLPLREQAVDLTYDLVDSYKKGLKPADTGLEITTYLFDILQKFESQNKEHSTT